MHHAYRLITLTLKISLEPIERKTGFECSIASKEENQQQQPNSHNWMHRIGKELESACIFELSKGEWGDWKSTWKQPQL